MRKYSVIDGIPSLTASEMLNASILSFEKYDSTSTAWDYKATESHSDTGALLHSIYSFDAFEGATYDILSVSFFDPFLLRLYDRSGNVIEVNLERNDPDDFDLIGGPHGVDQLVDWVAPYTGTYYVEASWNQGVSHLFHSLSIYEDLDTISSEPISAKAGRIFNWAEDEYSLLFPNHPETEFIAGFNARIYSSGAALGELDGDLYFYDGALGGSDSLILLGTVSDFLPLALADGF